MISIKQEECVKRLSMMRHTEERYKCNDYLENLSNAPDGARKASSLHQHRQTIFEWFHRLIDSYNIDRVIIYYGMNLIDRFLSSVVIDYDSSICDVDGYFSGSLYELLSLTALYIAMKLDRGLCRPTNISEFTKLSKRNFTAHDICTMEMRMLTNLNWKVFPPSPVEFIDNFMSLLFYFHREVEGKRLTYQESSPVIEEMLNISVFLTELAVGDYFFVTVKTSLIAFASVLIAMRELIDYVSGEEYSLFLRVFAANGLSQECNDVSMCIERLKELYAQNIPDMKMHIDGCEDEPDQRLDSSPVSVFELCK